MHFGMLNAVIAGIFFSDYFDLVKRFDDFKRHKRESSTKNSFSSLINPFSKINDYNSKGWQAIHFAVHEGNLDATKTLIETFRADINSKTILSSQSIEEKIIPIESTPLIISIIKGNLEIFRYLLTFDQKLDLNTETRQLKTPLHFAGEVGNLEMIEELISRNAKIGYLRGTRKSPFHLAIAAAHFEAAKFFSDRNLGLGPVCPNFESIIHFLARQKLPANIWMKMFNLTVEIAENYANKALIPGPSKIIERRSLRGLTALQVAVQEENNVAIAGLIVSGAEFSGTSSLLESLKLFLNGNEFNFNYFNSDNETIWHFCARNKATSLIQVSASFFPTKPNLRSFNSDGLTALDLAFEDVDRFEVALELIKLHDHVIDFKVLERVASMATVYSWDQIVEALINEFPLDFSNLITNSSSVFLLHNLATTPVLESQHQNTSTRKLVHLLVKNYPQIIKTHDKFGRTPLHLALECDFVDFFKWLGELKEADCDLDFNVKNDGESKGFVDLLVEKDEKAILELLKCK